MHNKLSPKTQRKSAWLFSLLLHTLIQNTAKNMWHAKHVQHAQTRTIQQPWQQTNKHAHRLHAKTQILSLLVYIYYVFAEACQMRLCSHDETLKWGFWKNKQKKTVPTVRTDPVIPFTFDCLIAYVFIWWRCKEMTHIRCSFTVSFHLQPTNELWR